MPAAVTRPPSKSAISRALHTLPWNERCPWCQLWPCHILTVKEKSQFHIWLSPGLSPSSRFARKRRSLANIGFEPGFEPIFFATWRGPTRERMVRSTPPPRSGAEGKFFTPKAYLHTSFCVQKMGDPELSFRLHRVLFCVEHKSTIPSAPLTHPTAPDKNTYSNGFLLPHAYPLGSPRRRPGVRKYGV